MEMSTPQLAPFERLFLSAEWRDLVMLNYAVEPNLLAAYVPRDTKLDSFNGTTYVSLVGFRFLRTKLFGFLTVPFHSNFDEVNLRFYVRRQESDGIRRGVVFISEIVPRMAIARIARTVYGENYVSYPMRHSIERNGPRVRAAYQWRLNREWCRLRAESSCSPAHPSEGSLNQFITEHYWGYTARPNRASLEYHVSHVPWRVWTAGAASFEGDASALYGPTFAEVLRRSPDSAFIAEGSPVLISTGNQLK